MAHHLSIDRPLVILTGGIACGKSAVADHLKTLGVDIVDTDRIAHSLTAPNGAALPALRSAFGDAIFHPDNTLDRAALRDIVFNDPDQKNQLEQILHPMIRRQAIEAISQAQSSYVVADVPLFAETGFLREQADRVLVVDCPSEIQKQRLLARGAQQGVTTEIAELILQAQAPRETRLALATEVIDNSGTPEARDARTDEIHQVYLALAENRTIGQKLDKNPTRM
ncbi:MAG: dephospho-CoA kinase [Rhodocyclaceae bacterium]|jgi:dephospho-CoA kinase|nr:dephospho-CoA kinase [Rhodocyclaceae bacterium]